MARAGLEPYRWKSRLLVISAPDAGDPRLAEQVRLLDRQAPGVRRRDLVIIRVVGGQALASDGKALQAREVRAATGLAAERFGVALIGKDGGEKFKGAEPISPDSLFQTIDAMPMRQDEMKRSAR